jgi:hypothetical protein
MKMLLQFRWIKQIWCDIYISFLEHLFCNPPRFYQKDNCCELSEDHDNDSKTDTDFSTCCNLYGKRSYKYYMINVLSKLCNRTFLQLYWWKRNISLLYSVGAVGIQSSYVSKFLFIYISDSYGYKTWSLTLRKERRLRMFENRVLGVGELWGLKGTK